MNRHVTGLNEQRAFHERLHDGLRTLSDHAVPPFDLTRLEAARDQAARIRRRVGTLAVAIALAAATALTLVFVAPSALGPTATQEPYLPAGNDTPPTVEPDPPDGFRWEGLGEVAVAVPEEWGNGAAPRSDYCHRDHPPTLPYADADYTQEPSIGACEPFPDDSQTMHITLNPAADPAPWNPPSTIWRQQQETVGDIRITVVYEAAQAELAARILASAHQR